MSKRKKYTPEFKAEAVRQVESRGTRTVLEVAQSLGVSSTLLHGWRKPGAVPVVSDRGESPEEELRRLAPPENEVEEAHPLALHGRAARALAASWGVRDEEVLEAIEGHVYGVDPENGIGMALYVADVSEPGRGVNEEIRELALAGRLKEAYRLAVRNKVHYLKAKKIPIHPRTLEVYHSL